LCAEVDLSAPGEDFPAGDAGALVIANWPATAGGDLEGHLQGRDDLDSFAIAARERSVGGWCWNNNNDDPLRAELVFTAPGSGTSATVCACWSATGRCDRSREVCATSIDGAPVDLGVLAAMRCRSRDELLLDIRVTPLSTRLHPSCAPWRLGWSIRE
jgi:hypothetical protein